MIEIDCTCEEGIIAIRCDGVFADKEFTALAGAVADFKTHDAMLLLLDWRGIVHWAFSTGDPNGLIAWRKAARRITRVAIVHGRRLNRQAAWLGAALRGEGVAVRSWAPQHTAAAMAWLRTPISAE